MNTYTVQASAGSVRIVAQSAAFYIYNGAGDGKHLCHICERTEVPEEADYETSFEVFGNAYLSEADSGNSKELTFLAYGYWYAYSLNGAVYLVHSPY